MPYQPLARYELLPEVAYSTYSRPRRVHPDGSYEIHLVKAADPNYIPHDYEAWPLFQSAILAAIEKHPAASNDAYQAYLKVREKLTGKHNPDSPNYWKQ